VGDRVTNVIEVGAEPASDVQLGGQNAINVAHEFVVNNQRCHGLATGLNLRLRHGAEPCSQSQFKSTSGKGMASSSERV